MIPAFLLGVGLLTASPSDGPSTYEEARQALGRAPGAHRALALWCESRDLAGGREEQLDLAVLADPKDVAARGLKGQVDYRGRWRHPEDVADLVRGDATLARLLGEYDARRNQLDGRADGHWALALWCEENGLSAEARGHLAAVTRLDPERGDARERLGYRRHQGRWELPDRIAAEEAEARAQALADREWRPRLERWKAALAEKDRRASAESELAGVTDPRAVPMIEKLLVEGDLHRQHAAVLALRNVESPAATRALARLAVHGHVTQVRAEATEALAGRNRDDFVGDLVAQLRDPIHLTVVPVAGPGSLGELVAESPTFRQERLYHAPPLPQVRTTPEANEFFAFDPLGLPCLIRFDTEFRSGKVAPHLIQEVRYSQWTVIPFGQALAQAGREVAEVKLRQRHDVRHIKHLNATLREDNGRVVAVLRATTGRDFGVESAGPWRDWWSEEQGFRSERPLPDSRSTIVTDVEPRRSRPVHPYVLDTEVSYNLRRCCFAAGTPVWTLAGRRPIESIRVGDEILGQDPTTGALAYRPVMAVEHNPPDRTRRVVMAGGKAVVATDLHRLWKAGQGWTMVRNLRPGDVIRTLGGSARVESIEDGPTQPTYNLQTYGGEDYFAGEAEILAHDSGPVHPVPRPFDARPTLTAVR